MSRGHRGVILAIGLGLIALWSAFGGAYTALLLTGDQQRHEYDNSRSTVRDPSTPGKFAAYPDLNASACYKAQNHDTADLCAQWRAAIAAEKAAESARDAVLWTIIGTFLSSVGLAALVVTIRQGREGLETAQTIGQAQIRAYLHIDEVMLYFGEDGSVCVRCTIFNSGQSPARNVSWKARLSYLCDGEPKPRRGRYVEGSAVNAVFDVPAGGKVHPLMTNSKMPLESTELTFLQSPSSKERGLAAIVNIACAGKDVFQEDVLCKNNFTVIFTELPHPNQSFPMTSLGGVLTAQNHH